MEHYIGLWLFLYATSYFFVMWQYRTNVLGEHFTFWGYQDFMFLGGIYRALMATAFTTSFFLAFS